MLKQKIYIFKINNKNVKQMNWNKNPIQTNLKYKR